MKLYNEYLDNISVSDALHRKFVLYTTDAKPVKRLTLVGRYAMVLACCAVILLSTLIAKNNRVPENSPWIAESGIDNRYITDQPYSLTFNKATSSTSSKLYIPGHFWQTLSKDALKILYPLLTETHTITATANFTGDSALLNIDTNAVSNSGLIINIELTKGTVTPEYIFDNQAEASNVLGTTVKVGFVELNSTTLYFASFELGGTGYFVQTQGGEPEKAALTTIVGQLVKGGKIDLDTIVPSTVPTLREEVLDIDNARSDLDFGAYLPLSLPSGFTFESALRFVNQERNQLTASWIKGMAYINWKVSFLMNDDELRITSTDDRQNYDLSLYPIPRADSVPDKLREVVNNPVFRIENLTLDVIKARAYQVKDAGDTAGFRMQFGVLYGNKLVELNIKGASPEVVFEMLNQIKHAQ